MPRPQRCRRICREPAFDIFLPDGIQGGESVTLTCDEYEALRLVDYEKRTHEQCAELMEISRSTVTEIYESARYKLADCLLNGKTLRVTGGNYRLCDGSASALCGRPCTRKAENAPQIIEEKGEHSMRIAVTYENGQVFQHFGHTEQFKFYDVEHNQIVNQQIVAAAGEGHGALADFLKEQKVDILICGGIGGGAQQALSRARIHLMGGVKGGADEAVQALINGTLLFDPNVRCDHHDHGAHDCGSHSCGSHTCH